MPEYANLNKEDLRKQLLDWMMENPMSFNAIANELGVASKTLRDFVNIENKREPNFKILLIIAKFLRDKEGFDNGHTR